MNKKARYLKRRERFLNDVEIDQGYYVYINKKRHKVYKAPSKESFVLQFEIDHEGKKP